ncbi:hypothetical protein OVN18_06385 [Microcella daejeonensis]|uniref:Uncharacterized protein n=1 Tax=Microcella daejeonensis TaxID=2994971 RepID=A0A9E8MN83_9MICO|nr:hypothetical protein [Microcella daejeonensis]WAB82623.1 hypothetical protein OVN18_06385 [Microcella daejeonensis]
MVRAQFALERVEFDRRSLEMLPEYRAEVDALAQRTAAQMRAAALDRLQEQLTARPHLREVLRPSAFSLALQVLAVLLAAGAAAVFLTRSGVDPEWALPVAALLHLSAALIVGGVTLRTIVAGPPPTFLRRVVVLVVGTAIPGVVIGALMDGATDPALRLWWWMLVASATLSLVVLAALVRSWVSLGTAGRSRVAAEVQEWLEVVRLEHSAAIARAAAELDALWSAVDEPRRLAVAEARDAAVAVLDARGFHEEAAPLRTAVPGAVAVDAAIAPSLAAWGAGSQEPTSARLVPASVPGERPETA